MCAFSLTFTSQFLVGKHLRLLLVIRVKVVLSTHCRALVIVLWVSLLVVSLSPLNFWMLSQVLTLLVASWEWLGLSQITKLKLLHFQILLCLWTLFGKTVRCHLICPLVRSFTTRMANLSLLEILTLLSYSLHRLVCIHIDRLHLQLQLFQSLRVSVLWCGCGLWTHLPRHDYLRLPCDSLLGSRQSRAVRAFHLLSLLLQKKMILVVLQRLNLLIVLTVGRHWLLDEVVRNFSHRRFSVAELAWGKLLFPSMMKFNVTILFYFIKVVRVLWTQKPNLLLRVNITIKCSSTLRRTILLSTCHWRLSSDDFLQRVIASA